MLRYILVAILSCFILKSKSQDRIVKITGDTIAVSITKTTESNVEFTYPNESSVNELSKTKIFKIIYASGRKELIEQKIKFNKIYSKDDWEKVTVVYHKEDVEGLELFKTVSKSSMWGGSLGSNLGYNDVIKKLKKEAAKNKCRVVFIVDNPSKNSAAMGGGVKLVAEIYK